MNRYSVLYLLNERYHHIGCNDHQKAITILQTLINDSKRTPVGIYDAKTELFEWEPDRAALYAQAGIEEQGREGESVILLAQALRRRDASWHSAIGFSRPNLFA